MKKIILSSLFVSLSLFVFAQGSAGQGSLIVKATPVAVLRNMLFTVHGEYAISSSVSLGLGLSPNLVPKGTSAGEFLDMDSDYVMDESLSKSGFSIDPEFRWYSDNMMDGFFVGAYSSFRKSSATFYNGLYGEPDIRKEVDLKTFVMVVGPQFGWEKLLGKSDRFVFDGYIGIGLKMTNRSYTGADAGQFGDAGMTPFVATRGNVSIGYRIK